MMKPKAALVKDGFLPAGSEEKRGRLSGAAIARCMELAAQGWDIEGYALTPQPVGSTAPREAEKVKVATGAKEIADIGPGTRDPRDWEAFSTLAGKEIRFPTGIKGVCINCHNSFTYCRCTTPMGNVSHEATAVVYFKPTG